MAAPANYLAEQARREAVAEARKENEAANQQIKAKIKALEKRVSELERLVGPLR